jgi:hypothetical protein
MRKTTYIILTFLLSYCFTPDGYLPKIDTEKININLSSTKNPSTFIKLDYPPSFLTQEKNNWQLKFENATDRWDIYTNPDQPIRVFNTKINRYDLINKNSIDRNTSWEFDKVKSSYVKSIIGNWGDFNFPNPQSYKDVYIINWGQDTLEYYYKFQILDAGINTYHFKYGPLDGPSYFLDTIYKDEIQLYSYFTLVNNEQLKSIEPSTREWHIKLNYQVDSITKHPKIPYSSTSSNTIGLFPSVELNHRHVKTYIDSLMNYEQINYINSKDFIFEKSENILGLFYQKDPTTNQIKINPQQTLIVQSLDEFYAIRAINLTGSSISNHSITLEIKKL